MSRNILQSTQLSHNQHTSSWGDSKIYTSASIGNSQRMKNKINESRAIAKIRIWVAKRYCQTLKTFRITSSKMKILLILIWWCFSCLHIQRITIQYTDQLFWKIIAYEQKHNFHKQTSISHFFIFMIYET